MSPRWKTAALRIDALSLRERVILFLSVAACLAALADALVLSPQMAQHRAIAQRMHEQNRTLATLRERLSGDARARDDSPRGRALRALDELHAQERALEARVQALHQGGAAGVRLPALLERVLRRHERLTLLQLQTPTAEPRRAEADAPPPPRGVDLAVRGAYPDLLNYLTDLERSLPGLRWGPLHLDAREQPPVLRLRVYLVGDGP